MCMVDGKSCLPYEASRSCEELSGTAAFSFYSAWNRRTPNNSPCEIILEGDQERYQCDEDFYAQSSVSARLRITSESSSRGSFENDVTTTKAFMYLTGTSEFVQRQIEVSRGLYKDLKMSFMMSQLAGPGFVPAVAIWFSNGDDVTELKLLSATSGDPQSGITPIQNGIDLVDNTKYCFVSAGTEQNNWALIDIPFAFVSHVELLNRYIQNERMEGTVVEVCDRPGHCTLCGVAGSAKASAWATVECVGGPLRGNQIRLDQSSSVLQFCEIKVFGKVALNCFHRADVAPNAMFEVPSDRSEDTTGLNFCIDKTYCPEFKKFTMCVTPDPLSTRNIAPLGCTSNLVDQCPTGSLPAFDFYSGYSAFAGYIPPCVESAIGYLKVLDCYVTANASYGLLVEQFDGASGTSLAIDYLPTGYPVFTNLWVAKQSKARTGWTVFVEALTARGRISTSVAKWICGDGCLSRTMHHFCRGRMERIQGYTLLQEMGSGSFGRVERAALDNGDQYAMKIMYPNLKEMADDEIRVLSSLRHPFILEFKEHFQAVQRGSEKKTETTPRKPGIHP